jgi:hypothetical protein
MGLKMSKFEQVFESPLGRLLIGLLLLILAPIIAVIVSNMPLPSELTIGDTTVDLSAFIIILKFIIPFMLLFTGLRYLGVKL